jgi:hypothetical protein
MDGYCPEIEAKARVDSTLSLKDASEEKNVQSRRLEDQEGATAS